MSKPEHEIADAGKSPHEELRDEYSALLDQLIDQPDNPELQARAAAAKDRLDKFTVPDNTAEDKKWLEELGSQIPNTEHSPDRAEAEALYRRYNDVLLEGIKVKSHAYRTLDHFEGWHDSTKAEKYMIVVTGIIEALEKFEEEFKSGIFPILGVENPVIMDTKGAAHDFLSQIGEKERSQAYQFILSQEGKLASREQTLTAYDGTREPQKN